MIYKVSLDKNDAPHVVIDQDGKSFPFDPANTDYATFKAQILAGEAELQDANGNVMIPAQAKEFVASLP